MSEAVGAFVIITVLLAPLLGFIVWEAYAIRKCRKEIARARLANYWLANPAERRREFDELRRKCLNKR